MKCAGGYAITAVAHDLVVLTIIVNKPKLVIGNNCQVVIVIPTPTLQVTNVYPKVETLSLF